MEKSMNKTTGYDALPGSNSYFSHRMTCLSESMLHYNTQLEYYLVLEGEGQITIQDKKVFISPGDFLFFQPNSIFSITAFSPLKMHRITIQQRFFEDICPDLARQQLSHFHIAEPVNDAAIRKIYQDLAHFVQSWALQEKANSLEIFTCICSLTLHIYEQFGRPLASLARQEDYISSRIRMILEFVAANYDDKISVSQISSAMGLNPQYFSTFFTNHFQQSFIDFLNNYRINHCLNALRDTSIPMTQIAMNNGFQTYRSFSNAFHKANNMSPSEYRQQYKNRSALLQAVPSLSMDPMLFQFLWKYIAATDTPAAPSPPSRIAQIKLDLTRGQAATKKVRLPDIQGISIGSGYQLLQETVHEQLKRVSQECRFTHVHFRDPFGDQLYVYSEPVPDHPVFTWNYLDEILQKIRSLGLYPYIELGFMPRKLAATRKELGYGTRPHTSKPRSIQLWQQMVESFLLHCLQVYGSDDMEHWIFDFWNSANICAREGYWTGAKEEFFSLYEATYQVFQKIAPSMKLGSPNFSLPTGLSWYEDCLAFCSSRNIRPHHLSVHLYACGDNLEHFQGIFPYEATDYNYLSLSNMDMVTDHLQKLTELLAIYGFEGLPIISGEWNLSFYLSDLIRDTAFMGTYIAHSYLSVLPYVKGITYSILTDTLEYSRPTTLAFSGGQGFLSRTGLAKPAYHALYLLHKLGAEVLYRDSGCMITRSLGCWQILLYNISNYARNIRPDLTFLHDSFRYNVFMDTESITFHAVLQLPAGDYSVLSYRLDREHGCVYDAWIRMGSPAPITEEIHTALTHASYPEVHKELYKISREMHLQCELKPHTVVLYEIKARLQDGRRTHISPGDE